MRSPYADANEIMSQNDLDNVHEINVSQEWVSDFDDIPIRCIDCSETFDWTAGEQEFYKQKQLENPPKRCKPCKIAKNKRLRAIEQSRLTGKKPLIEFPAECARCAVTTTVPFYPSQRRPVYCRACFNEMKIDAAGI